MPRRIADWWASFSQGSDHPSSAFSCSESWRMTSRWWWAHCGHLAESRLFMKEPEPGPGWECLAHHAMLLRKEQTCREQEFQGSRVFVLLIMKAQLSSAACLNIPCLDSACLWEWRPRHFRCFCRPAHPFKTQVTECLECGCYDWETEFFNFCLIFITLDLNRAWH